MAEPAPARPAATVLLLRDGPAGPEVFMVVRHRQIEFAAGALVFPGGRVEPADAEIAAGLGTDDPFAALRVAAIREAFEESGLLLARTAGGVALTPEQGAAVAAAHRDALNAGSRGFAALLQAEGLVPDIGALVRFAHWVTPDDLPKRFDTHFFLAPAPGGHAAAHDGREAVDSVWITPEAALAAAEAGTRTVLFPTRLNLGRLAGAASLEAAMAAARAREVVRVQPVLETDASGARFLRIPVEAGYGGPLFPAGARAM
ncbi:NUDIX domain-containing protein [Siccirubricoccus sp. KC 17139]|uniref:NUDIX domain-containing protein n=1 Tax=Siccirubricoccus soli TaxID=2899147 RepID=A0ABT1D796_9PROT|nr:NUDIX domain-containing protein [Siccirubricoccus soli]MCO6417044.1 NUDIX domain-containing protein [Siccirubricoccus soli]MCP2683179.1 NUDIX domain-containing protein [Siccirubricoccus soli]